MRKSDKQNNALPLIDQKYRHSLQLRKDKFYVKPRLQRIIYSPFIQPKRLEDQANIMKAYFTNKNFEDIQDEANEEKIQNGLYETKMNFEREEKGVKQLIGKQAPMKYYENYKKINKILSKRKAQTENIKFPQKDPTTAVLEQAQKLKVLPRCLGLVKIKGQPSVLNLNGHKLGDVYIKAISAGLKGAKLIQNCDFSNNRLTDAGFNEIIKNIGNEIIRINVSFNQITRIDQKLINIILEPEARLEYLNLQSNLITDGGAEALCRNSSYSKNLKYLNLRKNLLTSKCSEGLIQLMKKSNTLEEFYIGTNRIYDDGAMRIIESLANNKTIKVFDYSFNKLGESTPSCSKAICNFLNNNKTVTHCDFSCNNFNIDESKLIGQSLENNKTVYGFHFRGNYGYIDSKGFLIPQEKDFTSLHSLVDIRIQSYDIVFRREQLGFDSKVFKNVCWICEGWHEQMFRFTAEETDSDGKKLVYIHFDFEQYEPRLINITERLVKYKTMVPPKKYKYFFTHNKTQYLDTAKQSKEMVLQFPESYKYEMYCQTTELKIKTVSVREGKVKKIVNAWDELIVEVIPRQIGLVTKKQKKPWSFKDSIWYKEWKLDNDQLLRNCFERDWKNSKLMNIIKNQGQQQKVKQFLFGHYKFIKEIYKHYSSWSPFNGDIWAVANNAFTQFCHEAKIISKEAPLKIIDLTFITTNSMSGPDWKGNQLVPERGLIRFQFMESLVRLAEQKYKKNGLTDSILGSIQSIFKEHISPLYTNQLFQNEAWRKQKYFIEQNDMLIKKYRPIFTQLYKKNSKLKVKPGNKPFMCLAQFKSLFERIGIAGNQIQERDINISFNYSMMTQVDEIESERFMKMSDIQFIEGVARCSSILSDACRVENVFGKQTPMYGKFQWIIHELKKLCCEDVKGQFSVLDSIFKKSEYDE